MAARVTTHAPPPAHDTTFLPSPPFSDSVADGPMAGIPPARDTDAEDVSWALQTAETQWRRNERADALVWLRRAARAAADENDDDRAIELGRAAAELSEALEQASAAKPSLPPIDVSLDDVDVRVSLAPVSLDSADVQSLPPSAPPSAPPGAPKPVMPAIPRAPALPRANVPPRAAASPAPSPAKPPSPTSRASSPPSSHPPSQAPSSRKFPVPPQFLSQLGGQDPTGEDEETLAGKPSTERTSDRPAARRSVPPRPSPRVPGSLPPAPLPDVRPPMPTPIVDMNHLAEMAHAAKERSSSSTPPPADDDERTETGRPAPLAVDATNKTAALPSLAPDDPDEHEDERTKLRPNPRHSPRARIDTQLEDEDTQARRLEPPLSAEAPRDEDDERGEPALPEPPPTAPELEPRTEPTPAEVAPTPPRPAPARPGPPRPSPGDGARRLGGPPRPEGSGVARVAPRASAPSARTPAAPAAPAARPALSESQAPRPHATPEAEPLPTASAKPEPDVPEPTSSSEGRADRTAEVPAVDPSTAVLEASPEPPARASFTDERPTATADTDDLPRAHVEAPVAPTDVSTREVAAVPEHVAASLLSDSEAPPKLEPSPETSPKTSTETSAEGPPDIASIEAFGDLPDDARETFAAKATVRRLVPSEVIESFALACVLDGDVDVAPAKVDVTIGRISKGNVLRAQGTPDARVAVRLVGSASGGTVAVWDDAAVGEAFGSCPWVEDDLRAAGDALQALAGVTQGPLGTRIDSMLRELVTSRLAVRSLLEGETLVERGAQVPGIVVVGVGQLDLVDGERVVGTVRAGEFLFPEQVLGAGMAPASARAGSGGALVMFGDRKLAQELLVTVPPLLEILAGM